MKNILPLLFGAALLPFAAQAQSTSNVVGYITHTVNKADPSPNALTIIGPSLFQSVEFAATSTASPSGGSVITFAGGVPAGLDTTYVLEITAGDQEGWWSTVMSSDDTAQTITVNDAFPASLPADTAVVVRKHNTVLSFLGANNPGLNIEVGDPVNNPADEVQLLGPPDMAGDQAITAIVYATAAGSGAPADGWYYAADFSPADAQIIEPGQAIMIKNFQGSDLTFTSAGDVKETKTQVDVFQGLTLVAQTQAAGSDLDGTGLPAVPPQMIEYDGSNEAVCDEFQFLGPDSGSGQGITAYAAIAAGVAGNPTETMWNLGTSAVAGTDPFAEGTGAIFKRKDPAVAGVVTLDGTTVAP